MTASAKRRVVVTGMGLLTPLGIGLDEPWNALISGRSGIGPITKFDAAGLKTPIAGEVKDFDPKRYFSDVEVHKMDAFIQYAVVGGMLAMEHAGWYRDGKPRVPFESERFGCFLGVGMGGVPRIESTLASAPRVNGIPPSFIPAVIPNLAAGQLSVRFGLKGPSLCIATACSSGLHSVGEAYHYIERGIVDAALCGGAEGALTRATICGFNALRTLSRNYQSPETACRPFDYRRDGFVVSEGAGVLVLEALSLALERRAPIFAEIAGYGLSSDGYHITAPDPDGDGAYRSMKMAVADSGLNLEDFGYINAHGTATLYNDFVEVLAVKRLFGEAARRTPISSTKSSTGHLLGAAGAVETIFTALALYHGILPATLNFERADDPDHPSARYGCDPSMDYVPNEARARTVRAALCNAFGFGGANASLAIARWDG